VGLREEIGEQPAAIRRLLVEGREAIARAAAAIRAADVESVLVAARGTSDHAAIYAQYVLGARHRLPVGLATPSLVTLYGVEPAFRHMAVIGISQSGASPDVVAVLGAAHRQRVPTIAITNTRGSPLAESADHVIELHAGEERAVAATKTYTTELVAIALLSALLADDQEAASDVEALPAVVEAALEVESTARQLATERAGLDRCVVLGRGFEYATAREWALKMKELARVIADPYSAADFQHGPLALLEAGFPVLAVVPSGNAQDGLVELLGRLSAEFGVDLVTVTDRVGESRLGAATMQIPGGTPDWLTPVVSIVPCQLFAYHLARRKGEDPDAPRHIRKVTLTR
jgi:glucosamine--fructose-6-phosphate aminotransferase (isomerizing)